MKKKYYAKRGITEYLIIDRDKAMESRRDSYVPDQKVIVYTLNDKRQYQGRVCRGSEEVRSRFFDGITAKEMLSPSCPSGEQREKMRTLKKDQAEIIRRKDEEILRKDEELQLEKQERKKEEERRRKAEEELQREKKEKEEMLREIERHRRRGSKESDDEVKKGKEKRRKLEDSGGTARRGSAAGEHSKKGNRS